MAEQLLETPPLPGNEVHQHDRWQEHWPSLAYDINYDYKNNPQLDPQTLSDIMGDLGATQEEVNGLTFVVENPIETGMFEDRTHGAYGRELIENHTPGVLIRPELNERKTTGWVLHEVTHYLDDMRGAKPELSMRARKLLGGAVVAGFVALKTSVEYKVGIYDNFDASSVLNGVNSLLFSTAGIKTGSHIGYRLGSWERRAFKAQKNKAILQSHGSSLYIKPEEIE